MGNLFHTKQDPPLPTAYWLALSSTEPHSDGTGVTEPAVEGTGYSRVQITNLSEPDQGVITNTAPISFEESLDEWGIMTYYAVYDMQTDGHLLFFGALNVSRHVEPNTIITVKTGELTLSLEPPAADG